MRTYRDASQRVTAWVTRWADRSTGLMRGLRLTVGWMIASIWLIGLLVVVTAFFLGRTANNAWQGTRLRLGLRGAQRRHKSAIRAADKKLRKAEKGYSKDIAKAKKQLQDLESPNGSRLASYRGIQLCELAISGPQGNVRLEGTRATVDATGNVAVTQRATLTRMGAGAIVAGPVGLVAAGVAGKKKKKHDFRELYLTIETSSFSTVIRCNPNDGLKARNFAARVNSAAEQAATIRARRPQEITAARSELASLETATGSVDSARTELERVKTGTAFVGAIEAARSRLALGTGATTPSERGGHGA